MICYLMLLHFRGSVLDNLQKRCEELEGSDEGGDEDSDSSIPEASHGNSEVRACMLHLHLKQIQGGMCSMEYHHRLVCF